MSFQVDSVDVNSKTFVSGRLLDTHLSVDVLQQGTLDVYKRQFLTHVRV